MANTSVATAITVVAINSQRVQLEVLIVDLLALLISSLKVASASKAFCFNLRKWSYGLPLYSVGRVAINFIPLG